MHRKRHFPIRAINRTRRRINQMFDRIMSTRLQNIEKSRQIAIQISIWICEWISDTGLGGQVDHARRPTGRKKLVDTNLIPKVQFFEFKIRDFIQNCNPWIFQVNIIIIVQIIHPDHFETLTRKSLRKMETDETSGARNYYTFWCHKKIIWLQKYIKSG